MADIPSKIISKPGLVLSFDDYYFIEDWLEVAEMFKQFNANITFFIHAAHEMTEEHWKGLREFVKLGHCVGAHGVMHEPAVDYCRENGTENWIKKEVLPGLDILKKRGFKVRSFAYPCSQQNEITGEALKPYFHHARTGVPRKEGQRFIDLDCIFKPVADVADSFLLEAVGLDNLDDLSLIEQAFDRAFKRNELLFLQGHRIGIKQIGKDNKHLLNKDVLRSILELVRASHLDFYTFNDL